MREREPLFKRPLYKDWIAWLALVGVFAALADDRSLRGDTGWPWLVDLAVVVGLQVLLLGVLPATLRSAYRHWRDRERTM